jgi:hypothetical protein
MSNEIFDPIRKAVESQFKTWWDANGGGVPVQWDEVPFNQPASGIWVRFTLIDGEGFQASLGSTPLEKQPGVVVIGVFTPKNNGTKAARDLADKAGQAMRYKQLVEGTVTVHMFAPYTTRGPLQESHLQLNVTVPFEAQHVTQ